ncbi:MAG: FHA domain-containing protein [Halomonadaceae bacterium]|nr:MAG: FHA domain-containing protein [Halomonadaceae bacterium]
MRGYGMKWGQIASTELLAENGQWFALTNKESHPILLSIFYHQRSLVRCQDKAVRDTPFTAVKGRTRPMELDQDKVLELVITSYQRLSPSVVSSQQFSPHRRHVLGRSPECDWHLPDPERVISSRHGEIFCRDGQFFVRDISTNGLFLNQASEPLGEGNEAPINPGDQLRLGDYELAVNSPPEVEPAAVTSSVAAPPMAPAPVTPAQLGELPAQQSTGGNPTLAAGLGHQRMGDSHVDLPRSGIPQGWQWQNESLPAHSGDSDRVPREQHLAALLEGLGMSQLQPERVTPAMLQSLGELTRILLERLQELLRSRAELKQQLRVQQTLFRKQENNPLKFSATAADALDALLLRRHDSFLAPRSAVEEAFDDIMTHEKALLAGVEAVVAALLEEPKGAKPKRWAFGGKARTHDQQRRQLLREEYGESERMLRSDAFVEAYENASQGHSREPQS